MFVHLVALNVQNWLGLIWLSYPIKYMVTVQKLVLHLVDVCSLVQRIKSRFLAGRSRFQTGRKNNKSDAERCAKGDSRLGPRTKVNAMSKEDTIMEF